VNQLLLLRVIAPRFVAGIVVGERAAPILCRLIPGIERMSEDKIRGLCERQNRWKVEVVSGETARAAEMGDLARGRSR
jgi:hypothetical protein